VDDGGGGSVKEWERGVQAVNHRIVKKSSLKMQEFDAQILVAA
jgi:hypothetical protein